MGKIAEFLAGCPRRSNSAGMSGSWKSARAFAGGMFGRLYTLITRPHRALAEFGAGDYRTPFLFFLFFTVIWAVFHTLASILWMIVRGFDLTIVSPFFLFENLLIGPLLLTMNAILYLGVAVIVLALGLWVITGQRSWNPAFTIGAYCYPLHALPMLIAEFAAIPGQGFDQDPLVNWLGIALNGIGIILVILIAGYGIRELVKIPLVFAFIVTFCWIIVAYQVMGAAGAWFISPVENDLLQMVKQSLHPTSFPTAASLGNAP